MNFELRDLVDPGVLEAAAQHYEEHGFFLLHGVDAARQVFLPIVAERVGIEESELDSLLDPSGPPLILPTDIRQRLAKVPTDDALGTSLLALLEPVWMRLLGPIVHVSSDYHVQIKGADVKAVDHGGYKAEDEYLEVHGQYLIHQDFAGANVPTSPCQLTLWVGLNDCPNWNLRLYPGSHRYGLLCNEWLKLDDPRLEEFGEPIDVEAKAGTVAIFNSLLLHASSNPGPKRRVSCDIRFFPLCGFLPSRPRVLGERPVDALNEGLLRTDGPTLRAPILEDLACLGMTLPDEEVPEHSILNWAYYTQALIREGAEAALPWMERFVNTELGVDSPAAYTSKFHDLPIHGQTLSQARDGLASKQPDAPELSAVDAQIATLEVAG